VLSCGRGSCPASPLPHATDGCGADGEQPGCSLSESKRSRGAVLLDGMTASSVLSPRGVPGKKEAGHLAPHPTTLSDDVPLTGVHGPQRCPARPGSGVLHRSASHKPLCAPAVRHSRPPPETAAYVVVPPMLRAGRLRMQRPRLGWKSVSVVCGLRAGVAQMLGKPSSARASLRSCTRVSAGKSGGRGIRTHEDGHPS